MERVVEEERRRGRAKSVSPSGWAKTGGVPDDSSLGSPSASLSDLNDSFH